MAVRELYDDLLGAHGLAAFQRPFRWHFRERNFTSIWTPEGQHAEDFRLATTRCAEPTDNPPRLLIERHEVARLRVEYQNAHGRGVDQGLQVRPHLLFVPESTGVGDRQCRLGREHDEGLFVFESELLPALLLSEVDVAETFAPMTDRGSQKGLHRRVAFRKADRAGVAVDFSQSQRPLNLAQVPEESQALGQGSQSPSFFGSHPGGDEVLHAPCVVEDQERSVPGAGQRACAVDDPLKDGVQVESFGDAKAGFAQPGEAASQRFSLRPHSGVFPSHTSHTSHTPEPDCGRTRPDLSPVQPT